ncbi:hypothetical protein AVEN_67156-1 [Araneus ventricosus]|uniref:Uncharacterized protein n=1 Tax=Araneus ventricosus TaxID=182803 RepID=A0A4Y2C8E8_ARAVE|nr:hypothetical protein AVEN_67156-1 [Araneus ventricosus]
MECLFVPSRTGGRHLRGARLQQRRLPQLQRVPVSAADLSRSHRRQKGGRQEASQPRFMRRFHEPIRPHLQPHSIKFVRKMECRDALCFFILFLHDTAIDNK